MRETLQESYAYDPLGTGREKAVRNRTWSVAYPSQIQPTRLPIYEWREFRLQTDPQISNGCQDYYGGQIINTTQLNFNITGREIPRFSLVVRIMVVKISTQNLQV